MGRWKWGWAGFLAVVLVGIPVAMLRGGWAERRQLTADIDTWVGAGMPLPTAGPHLDRIRGAGGAIQAEVLRSLDTADESAIYRALTVLRLQGRLAPTWRWSQGWKFRHALELLDGPSKRGMAWDLLGRVGAAEVHDPNARRWRNMSHAFMCLAPESTEVSLMALRAEESGQRLAALRMWNATARMAPAEIHPAVAENCGEGPEEARYLALAILGRSRPREAGCVEAMGRALRDESAAVRRMALDGLRRVGPRWAQPAAGELKALAARDAELGQMAADLVAGLEAER